MIGTVQRVCCVCGIRLPGEKRAVLISQGCGTVTGSGQTFWHCRIPIHSQEEILMMIRAVPVFVTAKEYGKPIAHKIPKPEDF